METYKAIKILVDFLLVVFIALYIITGFGITEYRIVESITLNILTKPVSHQIHNNLIIPFMILLILHIILAIKKNYFKKLFDKVDLNEK